MVEPWPCNIAPGEGEGWWAVRNATELVFFCNEKDARQYAALPVLIATIRDACEIPRCCFCGALPISGRNKRVINGAGKHDPYCPGIAALKAAGEEIE